MALTQSSDFKQLQIYYEYNHLMEIQLHECGCFDLFLQYVLEADAKLDQLRVLVEAADREKVELLNQLEEEKRKVEDLQFRVEEACITKGDLETQTQLEHALLKELEQSLLFEKTKADKLQRELEDSRVATVSEKSRILELERDLALRDTEVAALRKSLEAVSGQDGVPEEELSSLHTQLAKNNEQLSGQLAKSKEENSNIIAEWRAKLASVEASHQQALEELRASHEAGTSELEEVRNALEQLELTHKLELEELANKRASEAMGWTGDAKEHKAQLLKVSEESERLVETLRTSLEKAEEQHLVEMEEVLGKLHSAELRVKELEDAGVKLGQQLREKAEEALEQETALQTLQSQHSQENRDMQRLLTQIEEAKSQARSQEEKVTELISVLEVKQQELSGLLQEKRSLEQEVSVLKQNLENTSNDQAKSAQTNQGLQRNLKASEERILLLTKDKTKLENDIVDMTKSTGDSSTLITKLNEEIKQKERRLEELQKQLEEEREKAAHAEEERSRAKSLEQKHRAELSSLQETIKLLEKSAADNQAKAKDVLAAGEKALADAVERHSKELQELRSEFDSVSFRSLFSCPGKSVLQRWTKNDLPKCTTIIYNLSMIKDKLFRLMWFRIGKMCLEIKYDQNINLHNNYELKQAVAEKAHAVEALKHEKEKLTVELASSHKDGNILLNLKKECDGLNDQLKEMKTRESTLTSESEKENAALQQSLRTQSALISEKDTELDSLRNELDALKQQNSQYEENLSSDRQKISEEIEELKQAVAEKAHAVEALKHEKEKLTVELASSHKDGNILLNVLCIWKFCVLCKYVIGESPKFDSLSMQLKKECDSLNDQLKEMKMRESTFTSESEKENAALQQSLRTQSALISEKDTELDSLRNEIAGLQSSLKLHRSESTLLQERVKVLESLADAQISGTDDSALKTWKEAKENAERQVEFLNSVIVDLQRKNEDLTSKLETMAEAALNGNGAAETDTHNSHAEPTLKKKPPPRLFCDICDCFDLHDTEDCPTQDQMLDSLPHTTYHGSTSDERPYCDICEVFGHWTESCKDDQTF
uniref:CAP-Gly domain-containing linker protein 1-like n=1 Tax=Sinocyclocheilus rhinocerous TaxID=307959 RepID=A0A673ND13_9TELE